MVSCGLLLKSALVAVVLVVVVGTGSAAEKLANCCTTVNKQEITDPILGYMVQKRRDPCVQAVIFQTAKGLFCSHLHSPWVFKKIVQFNREAKRSTMSPSSVSSSTPSLLSLITSSASPPSSAPPSSSPPASPRSFFSSTSVRPNENTSAQLLSSSSQ
ncbi:uncharacterized protein ACJ7VT_016449 [Polymixia lowei]